VHFQVIFSREYGVTNRTLSVARVHCLVVVQAVRVREHFAAHGTLQAVLGKITVFDFCVGVQHRRRLEESPLNWKTIQQSGWVTRICKTCKWNATVGYKTTSKATSLHFTSLT
jgi:hypothetical protein